MAEAEAHEKGTHVSKCVQQSNTNCAAHITSFFTETAAAPTDGAGDADAGGDAGADGGATAPGADGAPATADAADGDGAAAPVEPVAAKPVATEQGRFLHVPKCVSQTNAICATHLLITSHLLLQRLRMPLLSM